MYILRVLYRCWMRFARLLGQIQTTIILFFIYFIGVGVISMISFVFRKDFLDKSLIAKESYWRDRTGEAQTLENCRKQF